jgi:small subunit ribosomal protein S19
MAREFYFKGKTLEQLRNMPNDEFMKLCRSRERRALKRGLVDVQKKFLARLKKNPKKFHKIQEKSMVITPQMLGAKIGVYNGKEYMQLEIRPEMLGHRLGEFVLTRKVVKHSAPGFGATKSSKFVPLK